MRRTLEALVRRVREELRAEGPDGAGISDFLIGEALNSAQADLAEVFPIRDLVTFTTEEDENTYDLEDEITDVTLDNIVRIKYDGDELAGIGLDAYFEIDDPTTGDVSQWVLWGTNLIFIGEVEDEKTVELYITRAPTSLTDEDDVPELPYYADEAIIQYTISTAYRESRDYDKANYHYNLYLKIKDNLLKRGVPQKQRDHRPKMRDTYWGPVRQGGSFVRSDTDPGGSST